MVEMTLAAKRVMIPKDLFSFYIDVSNAIIAWEDSHDDFTLMVAIPLALASKRVMTLKDLCYIDVNNGIGWENSHDAKSQSGDLFTFIIVMSLVATKGEIHDSKGQNLNNYWVLITLMTK